MAQVYDIHRLETLIGRPVLARTTANKLGQSYDFVIDVVAGALAGLVVRLPDESLRLVDYAEVHSFGADAVMITSDESAVPVQVSPLRALPLARHNLVGANVVTEGGKLLGQIANIYYHLGETLVLIYEVRSSLFDKLLGHGLYFPASQGRAISADYARIAVAEDTGEQAANSLEALAARLFGPPREDPVVVIRSRRP
jgi:uncharacterized protein YrrD